MTQKTICIFALNKWILIQQKAFASDYKGFFVYVIGGGFFYAYLLYNKSLNSNICNIKAKKIKVSDKILKYCKEAKDCYKM